MNNQYPLTLEQIKARKDAAGRILADPKTNLTSRGRRRLAKLRVTRDTEGQAAKPAGEKYIVKLSTLTMHQLCRRLKQAARCASSFGHKYAKDPTSKWAKTFLSMQDNALTSFKHIQTEIAFRNKAAVKLAESFDSYGVPLVPAPHYLIP